MLRGLYLPASAGKRLPDRSFGQLIAPCSVVRHVIEAPIIIPSHPPCFCQRGIIPNCDPDRETALNGFRKRTREFSTTPFLLWHFSPGDKIENCSAQFLAVSWIVCVEFKVYRLRDGFSKKCPAARNFSFWPRAQRGKALWRVGRCKQKAQWRSRSAYVILRRHPSVVHLSHRQNLAFTVDGVRSHQHNAGSTRACLI